jgi:signal transduction histidine kinase
MRSHLKLQPVLKNHNEYSCVRKNFEDQKIIESIIKNTSSIENIDELLNSITELLTKELDIYGCLIQCFPHKNIPFVSHVSSVDLDSQGCLAIGNEIFNQVKSNSPQKRYFINSCLQFNKKSNKNLALTVLTFPLIYHQKYLGNLLFYNEEAYQWARKTIDLGEIVAMQIASLIYQNQLAKENYYLKEKEHIGQKTTYISHELRTPVSAIVGFSKMLLNEIYGELNPKQKDYISRIVNSGIYLLDLLNDLLDMAKINAQKEAVTLTKVNIKNLCQQVTMLIENQAKNKALDLIIEINTSLENVKGDEKHLKQILINLLSNSVKFTQKGSITLKVNEQNDYLMFCVIDTGIGLEKKDQEKLFKPFEQLSNNFNQKEKGSGLGLALSQQLAHLHGGKIICESQINQGSCFTFYLPIIKEKNQIN